MVATATTLEKSHPLTLGHPAIVHVPHELEILLKQYPTPALSQQILLTADTLKKRNTLNPVSQMPLPDRGEAHLQSEQGMRISTY